MKSAASSQRRRAKPLWNSISSSAKAISAAQRRRIRATMALHDARASILARL